MGTRAERAWQPFDGDEDLEFRDLARYVVVTFATCIGRPGEDRPPQTTSLARRRSYGNPCCSRVRASCAYGTLPERRPAEPHESRTSLRCGYSVAK